VEPVHLKRLATNDCPARGGAVLLNVITILEYQSHSSTWELGRHLTRHTEYFEEGNQVKIADKRAANKEAHAARERKAKTPDAQALPVTTRSRLSFPTNLVERVGHEKHWDKAAPTGDVSRVQEVDNEK
jgi:hypothetical protein